MDFETVVGMEVHVQLDTESKCFCPTSTNFQAPANTNVCPVSLGLPGTLPVLNKKAVEYSVMVGLALHCQISRWSKMDRKNYFYPDLAKNYQISQYDLPLCYDGWIEVETEAGKKKIGITRAHLEEDTASNTHEIGGGLSGVDFNRCGIPLLEIVTEPDIRSAEEAYAYLTNLKQTLQYLGVSDCNMEEGSLRAEANISVRPVGSQEFGTKTEVKNVASFSGVQKAIEYEVARQIKVLNEGGTLVQETRGWDADRGITFSQRTKESAHDYRYFPDPDLLPIEISEAWEAELKERLPELPAARRARIEQEYGIPAYDAMVLTLTKATADFYEAAVKAGGDAKKTANWVMGDLAALLTDAGIEIDDCKIAPEHLADMVQLIEDGTISGKIGKEVLAEMFQSGKSAKAIVEEKGLVQISDTGELEKIVSDVLDNCPDQVEQFKSGKERVIGFLVGQVMKASKGKANPPMVNEILRKQLAER